MNEQIWGGVFLAYIAVGFFVAGIHEQTTSGKYDKRTVVWIAGLALLIFLRASFGTSL